MKFAEANTELHWGRMLLARDETNDRESGREHLSRALAMSEERGYDFIARRAAEALEAS